MHILPIKNKAVLIQGLPSDKMYHSSVEIEVKDVEQVDLKNQ